MDNFKEDFKKRLAGVKTTRWVRFAIVALLFLAWVAWMGSWWLALFVILLFDIYITGYIPFSWWKNSKNKMVRAVMSWVDAIVYALILVYFIFAFVGQNYQIPSSSLEKTLLTGDYLFVNKMTYGPRVPMTPVYFPLVHNAFPEWAGGGKSYLESPSIRYKRLKGLRNVESGDIVVFNFPAGDSVPVNNSTTMDYYQQQYMYDSRILNGPDPRTVEKIYYPVDRRENYVKRCVGLPGERIKIVDGTIYIDGKPQAEPENVQFNYIVATNGRQITPQEWSDLGVSLNDVATIRPDNAFDNATIVLNGLTTVEVTSVPYYQVPLTAAMVEKLKARGDIKVLKKANAAELYGGLYPFSLSGDWSRANYGGEDGILIPAKGLTVPIDEKAWALYERPIRVYENNPDATFRDGHLYINGEKRDDYTFNMDYYFMMGDNRDNSLDSRYWGFVPEDHIVGTPWRVLISVDGEKGGIRWDRIFKDANPDK
ncbi:MAG: signal peptidase I [Bacteroidales bacterium]|nr:signal peptidase I [Bacteroidales bacterium]